MTKKHEELVEEVRLLWCEECANGPLRYEYRPDLDDICEIGAEEVCGERARKVVAYILSAVRDGRLDEELGVVGRWYLVGERWPPQYWTAEPQGVQGEKTIIALSPTGIPVECKEGTGKEEE